MSYKSWHIYGYGICVSDITEQSVERLETLLSMAPAYQKDIHKWLDEREVSNPEFEDYMEFDQDFGLGLASILKEVILEAEGVELEACNSYDGMNYLLYGPDYSWHPNKGKRLMTEKDAEEIFRKYISVLTDETIEIDYQSVENGC